MRIKDSTPGVVHVTLPDLKEMCAQCHSDLWQHNEKAGLPAPALHLPVWTVRTYWTHMKCPHGRNFDLRLVTAG